jgi:hypothetical protein
MKELKETLQLQPLKKYSIVYISCRIIFLSDMTDIINRIYNILKINYNNIF